MPTYTRTCTSCNHVAGYISKINDRNEPRACLICGEATTRDVDAAMVGAMGLADAASFVSPIDGKTYHGKTGFQNHNRTHGVLHESDVKGEAAHKQKAIEKEQAAKRKERIIAAVQKHTN